MRDQAQTECDLGDQHPARPPGDESPVREDEEEGEEAGPGQLVQDHTRGFERGRHRVHDPAGREDHQEERDEQRQRLVRAVPEDCSGDGGEGQHEEGIERDPVGGIGPSRRPSPASAARMASVVQPSGRRPGTGRRVGDTSRRGRQRARRRPGRRRAPRCRGRRRAGGHAGERARRDAAGESDPTDAALISTLLPCWADGIGGRPIHRDHARRPHPALHRGRDGRVTASVMGRTAHLPRGAPAGAATTRPAPVASSPRPPPAGPRAAAPDWSRRGGSRRRWQRSRAASYLRR